MSDQDQQQPAPSADPFALAQPESQDFAVADADAILDFEIGVALVLRSRRGVAMVSRDQGHQGDIKTVEPENFRVEDDILGVLVMQSRTDVGTDLVKNCRAL